MSLREYARKRDFRQTAEPRGVRGARGGRRFVIQKHAASRLHYDFRLEIDGTLKSWAVPKGMPFTKGEKRLAVEVEDHPVSYFNFEGTIPAGQYGGGTVMVWDQGHFTTEAEDPGKELKKGKLHFTLEGEKLKGEWYLVNMRHSRQWLLIKAGDTIKAVSKKADDRSALSGKTMAEISGNGAVWQSKGNGRKNGHSLPAKPSGTARPPAVRTAVHFIDPMKARLVAEPPTKGDWFYEIKFDGFRAQAEKQGAQVSLVSRNRKDFSGKFPEVAEAVAGLDVEDAIIDGEIVALDERGISSFQLLQAFEMGEKRPPIFFYAFDLLWLNGKDLINLPLTERKARLEKLLRNHRGIIRHSAPLGSDAVKLLKLAKKLGMEGLIGKRADSIYQPGQRSGAWIKLKLQQEQEFVIGGYTDPEGARTHFGALLTGFYERKKLKFCGKVGTGFDQLLLKKLHGRLQQLSQSACPFANLPETKSGRYHAGITSAEMKRCHWVKPMLVAQLKFSEWTNDKKLRQPVFLGLREDKSAVEVVAERPA